MDRFVVFSGGTGFNSVAPLLSQYPVSHILPVSDNGGSSEEIRRALGGVAVGDLRSRLIRLAMQHGQEAHAVNQMLQYRLPVNCESKAKEEWYEIIEGKHELWKQEIISGPYKDTIRAFLLQFQYSVMKQAPDFKFANGSIGNFFFVGAYLSMGSIEAAIFLVGSVLRIPLHSAVIPVVNTRNSLTLGAELENGALLIGQTNISHPGKSNCLIVDKEHDGQKSLGSKISRVFYVNEDLQTTDPIVNPRAIQHVDQSNCIIYSMGSLFTSIVPSLILKNVGESISKKSDTRKILILNAYLDRETEGMTALDFIYAVTNALNRYGELDFPPSSYINYLVVMEQSTIFIEKNKIEELNIRIHSLQGVTESKENDENLSKYLYNPEELVEFLVGMHNNN